MKMKAATTLDVALDVFAVQAAPLAIEADVALAILPAQVLQEAVPAAVVRWRFIDPDDNSFIRLPINPKEMSAPAFTRGLTYAFGSRWGQQRLRVFDQGVSSPPDFTFSGVILTKEHYDLLLEWSKKQKVIKVEDHLGRVFKVIITRYDPVERLPTMTRPWRADYTMTCMLLKEVTAS